MIKVRVCSKSYAQRAETPNIIVEVQQLPDKSDKFHELLLRNCHILCTRKLVEVIEFRRSARI